MTDTSYRTETRGRKPLHGPDDPLASKYMQKNYAQVPMPESSMADFRVSLTGFVNPGSVKTTRAGAITFEVTVPNEPEGNRLLGFSLVDPAAQAILLQFDIATEEETAADIRELDEDG